MTDVSSMSFDHIQVFVKSLQTIDFYKKLELENNEYREKLHNKQIDLSAVNDSNFSPLKQDLVQQLLWGLGCRVIAHNECKSSRSVLVASTPSAQLATRFIITAPTSTEAKNDSEEEYPYLSGDFANKFFSLHAGHEGFAVFGFLLKEVGACDEIYRICKEKHPALLRFESGPKIFNKNGQEFKILEIYTFYKDGVEDKIADEGTVMRFIEKSGDRSSSLPGFIDDEYSFPTGHLVSYFDHWVSNVMNRKQYLETLKDILGFNPKVDFNAGVVAAGGILKN
jgi:hypothetical protein